MVIAAKGGAPDMRREAIASSNYLYFLDNLRIALLFLSM
jgi:hypothetical protein